MSSRRLLCLLLLLLVVGMAEAHEFFNVIRNMRSFFKKKVAKLINPTYASSEKNEDGSTVVKEFRTVTLEVTPVIAEKVAVAQTIGVLSLSLRSLADNQTELERAIASGDVTIPDDATPEEEERILRQAMSRPIDGKASFVTGGDVSRFQRRTVPPQGSTAPQQAAMPTAGPEALTYSGPTVRVTRGKETTQVPVGGR